MFPTLFHTVAYTLHWTTTQLNKGTTLYVMGHGYGNELFFAEN